MGNEKDILHGKICSLCGEKMNLAEKNYKHILSDGTLCQTCQMTILKLLTQREWWVDDAEYMEAVQQSFNIRKSHSMPLEKAKELLALRDTVCDRFLATADQKEGSVFIVQNVFAMPKSPAIFILRAMKLKNKAVLQGFLLKGEVKKGDTIKVKIADKIHTFHALDVIPAGNYSLEKSVFFDELSTNMHKHKIADYGEGWIIIDTEEYQNIPEGVFAAAYK